MQIFAPQQLDATQALWRKKVQELLDHVNQCYNSGEEIDIGRATFVTVLNERVNQECGELYVRKVYWILYWLT